MTPLAVLGLILGYFLILMLVSQLTSRGANNASFFLGNRKSPWFVVAFGMLGASLSGVTFISVPGWVLDTDFTYMQMVLGYFLGYLTIAFVLLPLYYKLNLTSIYGYLDKRFGLSAYKTGAAFFLVSRIIGASFRLYIVASVLQLVVFDAWNVPFWITVIITIIFIWLYTHRGGIKTIIWTDMMQTALMLTALIATIIIISKQMDLSAIGLIDANKDSEYSRMFVFDDWQSRQHFVKQFLSGMLITIVMTGLDQDMMQKNLSCRNLKDAKTNMICYGFAFIPFNLLFLGLGVLLVIFSQSNGIPLPTDGDALYPLLAKTHLGNVVLALFILGLTASAYSSADSALTALTTSFTVDILQADKLPERKLKKIRKQVHVGMSVMLIIVILIFGMVKDRSVVDSIFTVASYTYGPLFGMFAFGILTKRQLRMKFVGPIAILAPILRYFIKQLTQALWGYAFAYELLLMNGGLCYLGLWLVSYRSNP
ncbi:MAG: sodium:solute symporter [Candidatus Delongbacteria bacterium]|jgi:SSS family solute:Na+ symporter|nr:sodium:solute symporter [Candidatus Delongbacteria bacterium]